MRSVLFTAIYLTAVGCPAAVTFDFAWVDNAGNAPDPETGFGSVPYEYAISKTEVTNAQYAEFLNAVDPTGENRLGLYNPLMADRFGGIERTGSFDGARYAAQPGRENNPATYISWYDAIRFANWMHNGQGSGDTETGAYDIGPIRSRGGAPLDGAAIVRSPDARFFLPSENEWYKAAYHDRSSGTAGVYFDYAITLLGDDGRPISDRPEDNPGAVNYSNNDFLDNGFNDGLACCGNIPFNDIVNPFTDVGAYYAAQSSYGTFDQNGNVAEWNEELIGVDQRGWRGDGWAIGFQGQLAMFRGVTDPIVETLGSGFRLASIPEPGTVLTLSIASVLLATHRSHRPR